MMGLYDTAYWLSWLTWEGITTLIASLFTVLFGMMFQFDFFSKNNFAVVFLVFFLFQLNMVWLFLQWSFVLEFSLLFLILPLLGDGLPRNLSFIPSSMNFYIRLDLLLCYQPS